MRPVLPLLSCLLLASSALASPYDWRAYPNGDATVGFELSTSWLLLSGRALSPEAIEQVLLKESPGAILAQLLPLERDRVAIQVEGLTPAALKRAGQALVRRSVCQAVWPGLSRGDGVGFVDDRVVYAGELPPEQLVKLGLFSERATALPGVFVARAINGDAIEAAFALRERPEVRFAEPDLLRVVAPLSAPDDPRFADQWHLESSDDRGDIEALSAWTLTTGRPEVKVAVFDTGFDLGHPELTPNIVGGFDAIARDEDPSAECSSSFDGNGPVSSCPSQAPYRESHGTAVAGIIAAQSNNQLLGAGVCPECSLFLVRLIGDGGLRSLHNAEAFRRATDEGAWVINNSWGPSLTRFFPLSTSERETFDDITKNGRGGLGVVLVFAAGNDFFTPTDANPYVGHPGVITVSASTRRDDFACYSSYGDAVSVAGPSLGCFSGEAGIGTTDVRGPEGYDRGDFTTHFSGTSAASPVVAGVAALVLAANPSLTAQQVKLILESTADKIRADQNPWRRELGVDLETEFEYDERGFSAGFGYGRVNACEAVLAASAPPTTGALCDPTCGPCAQGRCAPTCAADGDCPGSTRCLPLDGGLGCQVPTRAPGAPGSPCSADCARCVETQDSELSTTRVCSRECSADEDCPFGFDCRFTDPAAPRICVPGSQECGALWGEVRCQSGVRVEDQSGQKRCSCECIPGTLSACPDGFSCKNVQCQQDADGAIACMQAPRASDANYQPVCLPDPEYVQPCQRSAECGGGLWCIEGLCRVDRAADGCNICAPCTQDEECGPLSQCVLAIPSGRFCAQSCSAGGQCPGDAVCVDLPGAQGLFCVNPGAASVGLCPASYRCGGQDRCTADQDCAEGRCEAGRCPQPDAASPDANVDAAAWDASDPDASSPAAATSSDGCQGFPGHPQRGLLALLGLLALRRRRTTREPE